MIFDVLGIVIAFLVTILIFGILVTTLVELIQQFLQLRSKNLVKGFNIVIDTLNEAIDDSKKLKGADIIALKGFFLENPLDAFNKTRPQFKQFLTKCFSFIAPKPISVDWEELRSYMVNRIDDNTFNREVNRISIAMSQRFKTHIAIWTLVVSMFVAFFFQFNTFELLKDVPTNRKLRQQLVTYAQGQGRLVNPSEAYSSAVSYKQKAVQAIKKLKEKHPEQSSLFENISVQGKQDFNALIHTLEVATQSAQEESRNQLRKELEKIVSSIERDNLDRAFEHSKAAPDDIALFDFEPMPGGFAYYLGPAQDNSLAYNCLGAIITGLLLSLGAPYWFEVLQRLSILRKMVLK